MQNKHIVIVTNKYATGGTERRATVIANELVKNGYKVTYLVMNTIYSDVVYKLNEDIELVCFSEFVESDVASEEKALSKNWAKKKAKPFEILHRVAKMFKISDRGIKRRINLFENIIPLRAFIMMNEGATFVSFSLPIHEKICLAADGMNCKKVFSDINAPQVSQRPVNIAALKLLKNTDACIFQTFDQKECYGDSVKKNSYVIRNPITTSIPQRFLGKRQNKVVNFCRTHPQKNLILLVEAFKLFSEDYPEYTLEVYGATSTDIAKKYKEEVLEHICQLGLSEKVTLYDAVPDVHYKIFDCSMFVSSSDYEGLSNSMLEAMATGLPCICTDCLGGGARELITDGENGVLVPVKDVDALYKAMCRMVSEDGLAEKCSQNAYKVREELSVENIVNQWIEVIESL